MFPIAKRIAILGGAIPYWQKVRNTRNANLIGYWPLWEASGAAAADLSPQANNGSYQACTLSDAVGPDGKNRCPKFVPVSSSRVNIYSAGFAADFSTAEGTAMVWARVLDATVWTDGSSRRALSIRTDGANQIQISKSATNNTLDYQYIAGGTSEVYNLSTNPTAWFQAAITWSKAADLATAYYNGSSVFTSGTLGNWAGALANATISSLAGTGNFWNGWLAHAAIWNTPLTPTEVARLAPAPFLA